MYIFSKTCSWDEILFKSTISAIYILLMDFWKIRVIYLTQKVLNDLIIFYSGLPFQTKTLQKRWKLLQYLEMSKMASSRTYQTKAWESRDQLYVSYTLIFTPLVNYKLESSSLELQGHWKERCDKNLVAQHASRRLVIHVKQRDIVRHSVSRNCHLLIS